MPKLQVHLIKSGCTEVESVISSVSPPHLISVSEFYLLLYEKGLEFGEDDIMEIKRAKKIELFNIDSTQEIPQSLSTKVPVSLVMCGGMHTVVLTPNGIPYSWGCNDDGALGRKGGNDSLPERVYLDRPVDGLALGGSHSIFFNTELSVAYFCGLYRNSVQGKINDGIKTPL